MESEVAVIMVPFPAQGHLNQLLHLSHHIAFYGLPVHYAGSSVLNHQVKLRLQGWDEAISSKIQFHDFQVSLLSPPTEHHDPVFDIPPQLREPVCQFMQQLAEKCRKIVIIHDNLMASVVQDAKFISNAETYVFVSSCAFNMFFGIWDSLPQKPFQLDHDIPVSVPSLEGCLTQEVTSYVENEQKFFDFQSGFVFNTSRAIEGKYVKLVEMLSISPHMKHFAIGPFNPVANKFKNDGHRHECLEWLDKQEKNSVIYVSFGSTTAMTDEQVTELALGLERSGQKFIWVLRSADKVDSSAEAKSEVHMPVPEGYEEKVKDKGIIVRNWAPQLEILAHPSTGGFMSHCGWNSCIESISMGVPIAAWPMNYDQPRNTVLVTEVLRIGTAVRDWADRDQLITSTMIQNAVRRLMASEEGEMMRTRASELGEAVGCTVAKGCASHSELESFISHINR